MKKEPRRIGGEERKNACNKRETITGNGLSVAVLVVLLSFVLHFSLRNEKAERDNDFESDSDAQTQEFGRKKGRRVNMFRCVGSVFCSFNN